MEIQKLMNNHLKEYEYNNNLKYYLFKFIEKIKKFISIELYHKNLLYILII